MSPYVSCQIDNGRSLLIISSFPSSLPTQTAAGEKPHSVNIHMHARLNIFRDQAML